VLLTYLINQSWTGSEIDRQVFLISYAIGAFSSASLNGDRVRSVAYLENRQAVYEKLLGAMVEGVTMQDANGMVVEYNSAALSIMGMTADELTGKAPISSDWQASDENGQPFTSINQHPAWVALHEGRTVYNSIMNIRYKDGHSRCIRCNCAPLFNPENPKEVIGVVSSFEDISEGREQEKQLKEQQAQIVAQGRLSALGEMAAGIGHEINNPLTLVLGGLAQIRRWASEQNNPPTLLLKNVHMAEHHAGRIAGIVQSLRALARNEEGDPMSSNSAARIIQDAVVFAQSKLKHSQTELEVQIEHGDYFVNCHPGEIIQVVSNLIRNSVDACGDQLGTKVWVKVSRDSSSGKIIFAVEDNGSGIPESARSLIMTPFFTTKTVGEGTGLGLSLSRRLLARHGTELKIESFSKPTRFAFSLDEAQAQSVPTSSAA
jgi:PAS domain S-box-containing protein